MTARAWRELADGLAGTLDRIVSDQRECGADPDAQAEAMLRVYRNAVLLDGLGASSGPGRAIAAGALLDGPAPAYGPPQEADLLMLPGCDGNGNMAPAGQRGRTGCLHHYPERPPGCECPAWFDSGGWHLVDVNPACPGHSRGGGPS